MNEEVIKTLEAILKRPLTRKQIKKINRVLKE